MTLIINCLTRDYALQVSDRRLTDPKTGRIFDDETNKALLFCGSTSFAYTGLASIENIHTDVWLSKQLVEANCNRLDNALRIIRARSTQAFAESNILQKWKHHAFVGVGWAYRDSKLVPILSLVSNALDKNMQWKKDVDDDFLVQVRFGFEPHKSFRLTSLGVTIQPAFWKELHRSIGRLIGSKSSPSKIIDALASAIRGVASFDARVGKNLMSVCLPRRAINKPDHQAAIVSSPAEEQVRTFWYLPEDQRDGVQFGPISICGFMGFRDFTFTKPDPESIAGASIKVRLIASDKKEAENLKKDIIRRFNRAVELAPMQPEKALILFKRILLKLTGLPLTNFVHETLVKTNYEMGMVYVTLKNFEEAEKNFNWVVDFLAGAVEGEPLKYRILAANNAGITFLQQNRRNCEAALKNFEKALSGIDLSKGFELIREKNGSSTGDIIGDQITKSLRNIGLCALELGNIERSIQTLKQLEDFASSFRTAAVSQRISELKAAIKSGSNSKPLTSFFNLLIAKLLKCFG